jgi:hypothetical protein
MSTSTCRKPASEALILAGFLLVASSAAADYREAYRRGVEAANRESWADAARWMKTALAEQPREGELLLLDEKRTEPYLPHYYVGLALFHTGNCVAARREWEGSRAAIQRSPYFKTVARLNQDCQKRAPREAAANRAAVAVEAELRKAEKLATAVALLDSNPSLTGDERDALAKGLREARDRLSDARAKLDAGRRDADLGDLDKAREQTQRATADIEKTRRRAMSHLDPLAASGPGHAAPPPAAPVRAQPPAELVSAARAYFEGRYEDVVRALAEVSEGSGPAALQAHLLRAAARHALYVQGGAKDEGLRHAVMADVQTVRRIDPTFQPDATAFSPRFRELFKQGG